MKAQAIWDVARDVRGQLYGHYRHTPVEMDDLVQRCSSFLVNGIAFKVLWDRSVPIRSDDGKPVLGFCDYDGETPDEVMISLNRDLTCSSPNIEVATAAHELGHALFDMPADVQAGMQLRFRFGTDPPFRRRARAVVNDREHLNTSRTSSGGMNWEEYRANEFMGAFLAPPAWLHKRFMSLAFEFGFPLTDRRQHFGVEGLPVLADSRRPLPELEHLFDQLAGEFGVSSQFIRVRLLKYRLIPEGL
jgi:hypothetical protein